MTYRIPAPVSIAPVAATRFGIEIEVQGVNGPHLAASNLTAAGFPVNPYENQGGWKAVYDGSIGGQGAEIVSPPLPFNVASLSEVQAAYCALKRIGASVSNDCGLHVHVDATFLRNYTAQKRNAYFAFIVAAYQASEETFLDCVKRHRRNGRYCAPLRGKSVTTIRNDRYHALNLAAYSKHGTIEFRGMHGTLNEDAALAWVTLCVTFMDNVKARFEAAWEAQASNVSQASA